MSAADPRRADRVSTGRGAAGSPVDEHDPFGHFRKRRRRDRGIRWTLRGGALGVVTSALVWLLPLAWRLPFAVLGAVAVLWAFVGSCVWVYSTVPGTDVSTSTTGPVTVELYQQKESSLDHLMAQIAVSLLAFVGWVAWTVSLLLWGTGAM